MTEVFVIGLAILVVIVFAMMCLSNFIKPKKNNTTPPDAGFSEATKVVEENHTEDVEEIDSIVSGPNPEDELAARLNRRQGPL